MNACLIVLGILAACASPTRQAPDHWIAEDKLRHFTLSAAATTMGYGGARLVLDPDPARAAAGGGALALGLLKEVVDVRRGGAFSLKDLAWDAAGVALGLTLIHGTR